VVRSRSNRRILWALAIHLGSHGRARPAGLAIHATPLVRGGQVVLAPRTLVSRSAGGERVLARAGVAVDDGPAAVVLPDPPRVVLGGPAEELDPAGLDEVFDGTPEVPVAGPGQYELVGVAVADFPFFPDVSTPARAVNALVGLVRNLDEYGGQSGLELVADIVRRAELAVVSGEKVRAGLDATLELFPTS
jgi:hypothetical protein